MLPNEAVVHVIDDDEAIRASLTVLLESAGLEVRTYASANGFLEALSHDVHGCVVADVRMPDISGTELLRQLRMMGVALPVIVITGHADVLVAVEAVNSGAVDFFEKPFDDDRFLSSIRAALARQSGRSSPR